MKAFSTKRKNKVNRKELRKLINQLSPVLKETILLHHTFKMSFQEIADYRNISINTSLSRGNQAVKKMQRIVAKRGLTLSHFLI